MRKAPQEPGAPFPGREACGAQLPLFPVPQKEGRAESPPGPSTLTCPPKPSRGSFPPLPSKVNPPFHLSQKLDLAKAGLSSIIPLPPITPSLDHKDSASLYIQVPTLAHLPGLVCPRGAHPPTVFFSPGLPPHLPGVGSCSHAAHVLLSQGLRFSSSMTAPVSGGDSLAINPQILWNYWPIDLAKSSQEFSVLKLEVSLIKNIRERIADGEGPMGLYLLARTAQCPLLLSGLPGEQVRASVRSRKASAWEAGSVAAELAGLPSPWGGV